MRARIFTVSHFVPGQYVANALYAPLITGQAVGPHPVLISDEHGDNISHEQSYGEMRGQYFVWKNLLLGYDYVGFQQYRRWLFFDQMPCASVAPFLQLRRIILGDGHMIELRLDEVAFRVYMGAMQSLSAADMDAIRQTIACYDIITVRPWRVPIGEQYKSMHIPADWDLLARLLPRHSRFRAGPSYLNFEIPSLYIGNMYVMRASEFHDYMCFWQEFMQEFTALVKPHADPYQSRLYGFISERLFTLYLYQLRMERPGLKVLELPFVKGPQTPEAGISRNAPACANEGSAALP
jgi:hypothetical protein